MIYELIVIGASLGGLHALRVVLSALPADFRIPVVIVQHRQPGAEDTLSEILQQHSMLPVSEAEDKDPLRRGHVYLAPAGYHLFVEPDHFALSTEGEVNYSQPSIDVLFESAAETYGEGVVGVLLTGASTDGSQGLAAIKRCGGLTVVQDPETAEARTMLEAAIATRAVDLILPLREIGPLLAGINKQ